MNFPNWIFRGIRSALYLDQNFVTDLYEGRHPFWSDKRKISILVKNQQKNQNLRKNVQKSNIDLTKKINKYHFWSKIAESRYLVKKYHETPNMLKI